MSKHRGSNFDDFLKEEGIFEQVEAEAAKRIFIFLLEKEMKKQRLSKAQLAKKLDTSRAAVDRLLDPKASSTIKSLTKAACAVGKHLTIGLI
jgi:antitoxin HicB